MSGPQISRNLTTSEVAEILGMKKLAFDSAVKRRNIPYETRVGQRLDGKRGIVKMFNLDEVEKAMEGYRPQKDREAAGKQKSGDGGRPVTASTQEPEAGAAIRRYLKALEQENEFPRPRTLLQAERELETVRNKVRSLADPLAKVRWVQRELEVRAEIEHIRANDITALEDGFAEHVAGYSAEFGLSYQAWRAIGVAAAVLKRAGMEP